MSFQMTKDGSFITVSTQAQIDSRLPYGWKLVAGGSADDTTVLGEFPSMYESYTDFGNKTFRGEGITGEGVATLGYVSKISQPGLETVEELEAIKDFVVGHEAATSSVYTKIVSVAALPAEPSETLIYYLSVADSTHAVGMWVSNSGDWLAYTPGMVFDANYGADTEIALLATYVSSAAFAPLPIATANTKSAIEAILLAELQTVVNAGATKDYTVSFVGSAYSTSTGVWTGKIKVTNDANALDTVTDSINRILLFGSFVAMKLVTDLAISTVVNGTVNTIEPIKVAVLAKANEAIAAMTGYVVTIAAAPVCTYNAGTGAMACKFTVKETANAAVNVFTDATARALTITIAGA